MSASLWVGSHHSHWLARERMPLMVSRRALAERRTLPRRLTDEDGRPYPWVLDCGGFTELSLFGGWTVPPRQYVAEVRRFSTEIGGGMAWSAIQDWMCEPFMLAKTGLDVQQHQARTVASYLELRDLAPEVPWLPVLQGWTERHYHVCADLYEREGIDLAAQPVVGLGSVCRRQSSAEIELIVRSLAGRGYRLHGFGMKIKGLVRCADVLHSADSLAWSYDARRTSPLPGCTHRSCANCPVYARQWRTRVERLVAEALAAPYQYPLVAA